MDIYLKNIKKEEGTTLVEMIVAMTIFMIITTIVIGSLVALYRLQRVYVETATLNQEGKLLQELFIRTVREAESRQLAGSGDICAVGGSNMLLNMVDGSQFRYTCTATGDLQIRFGPAPIAAGGFQFNSNSVRVNSFNIYTERTISYPKVIRYEFELSSRTEPNVPTMWFRGYIKMRNEL